MRLGVFRARAGVKRAMRTDADAMPSDAARRGRSATARDDPVVAEVAVPEATDDDDGTGTRAPTKPSAFASHNARMAHVRRELTRLASEEPYYNAKVWRRTPYDATPYEILEPSRAYVAAQDVDEDDARALLDRLRTSVDDGWTDFVAVDSSCASTVTMEVKDGGPVEVARVEPLSLTDETLREPLRVGVDVEERPLWGIDCYTREAILSAISVIDHYAGAENRARRVEYLQKRLLPTLHTLGDDGWDMVAVARAVQANAEADGDVHAARASHALAKAVENIDDADNGQPKVKARSRKRAKVSKARVTEAGASVEATPTTSSSAMDEVKVEDTVPMDATNGDATAEEAVPVEVPVDPRTKRVHFRIHPKGTGVVCINKNGIKARTFVQYYAGEIYSPWRWYERQDAIKKCFPNMELPSFFNITLERPEIDERGRHTLFVEGMHKGSFASRLSHSCEPNCQTVTFAKDGKLALGMFTTHDIAYGEEMTWDYSCITESAEEYRNAFCLCSSPGCRGSFLTYSGSGAFTAVMKKKHGFLHRNAILFKACSSPVTQEDRDALHASGIRECALANCPDWVVKWAALTLEYIRLEERELPQALMDLPSTNLGAYTEIGAKHETIGVVATRFTNLVVTLDKIRRVLSAPGQRQAPFFRILNDDEIIDHLWSGSESIFNRLVSALLASEGVRKHAKASSSRESATLISSAGANAATKELIARISACDDTGLRPKSPAEARRRLLKVSEVLRSSGAKHARAADCLWFYGNTVNWFTYEKFESVYSTPVNIDDVAAEYSATTIARKLPQVYHGKKENMLRKKYGSLYVWGQLVTWFKQTIYSPDASLSADRRGTLSLPDPESAYGGPGVKYAAPERRALLKFLRNGMDIMWPTTMPWSFKNPSKSYGSPMFDEALRQSYPDEYTTTTNGGKTLDKLLDEFQNFI